MEAPAFDGLGLAPDEWLVWAGIVALAGVVRGFAGFGLSAILILVVSLWHPPVEVLPVNLTLELVSGLVLRGSTQAAADRPLARLILLGSVPATLLGLLLLTNLADDTTRLVVAGAVLVACVALALGLRPRVLQRRWTAPFGGAVAGVANGMGSIGGLFVALYMLSRPDSAERVRATIVYYLLPAAVFAIALQAALGVMTLEALLRCATFMPGLLLGIAIGRRLFRPSLADSYRRACLVLLCTLALGTAVRVLVT